MMLLSSKNTKDCGSTLSEVIEMKWTMFWFKVYKPGHAVFKYKSVFAEDAIESIEKIDEYCHRNGYIDFECVEE